MTNAKHTSGNWKAVPGGSVRTDDMRVADADGADIEEMEANARLIAAAPELLEALKMMLDSCYDLEKDDAIIAAVEAANAAIAKAEGR